MQFVCGNYLFVSLMSVAQSSVIVEVRSISLTRVCTNLFQFQFGLGFPETPLLTGIMSNNCFILNFVWSNVDVTEIHTFGVADFCQQLTTFLLPSFHLFFVVLRNVSYVFCYVIIVIQMIFFVIFTVVVVVLSVFLFPRLNVPMLLSC